MSSIAPMWQRQQQHHEIGGGVRHNRQTTTINTMHCCWHTAQQQQHQCSVPDNVGFVLPLERLCICFSLRPENNPQAEKLIGGEIIATGRVRSTHLIIIRRMFFLLLLLVLLFHSVHFIRAAVHLSSSSCLVLKLSGT